MDRYKETLDTWNKVAKVYEEVFMDLSIYNTTYTLFCQALPKTSPSVLELGCGPGNITKYILNAFPNIDLMGVDASENMLDLAQKNNPSATFKLMDCRNINQLSVQFDGILCGFILPYLSKKDCFTLLKNSYNILKSKGILYLSFVSGGYEKSGFQISSQGDRMYFHYYLEQELIDELKTRSFQLLHQIHIPYVKSDNSKEIHTVLICKKQ